VEMYVICLSTRGEIQGSSYTTGIFSKISQGDMCAVVVHAPDDVKMLNKTFYCEYERFLLVDDNGLEALRKLEKQIVSLGRINSAQIVARHNTILSPNLQPPTQTQAR